MQVLLVSLLVQPAVAAPQIGACSSGEAPSGYSDDDCDGVCTYSGGIVTCDIDKGNGTYFAPHQITAVEDFEDVDDRTFSVWGIGREVGEFCCFIDDSNTEVTTLRVVGTESSTGDTIRANHAGSGTNIESVLSELYGGDGPDTIHGSDFDGNVVTPDERIEGNEMADTIYSNAGEDNVDGNLGADVIWCGAQDDTARGGQGDDEIHGEGGEDTLYGEEDSDWLFGEYADDVLFGGDQNTSMTGDLHDILEGGPGADGLHSDPATTSCVPGAGPATTCRGTGAKTRCGSPRPPAVRPGRRIRSTITAAPPPTASPGRGRVCTT